MAKYRNIKIYVEDEETSKKVQELLFEDGCRWNISGDKVRNTNSKYLYVDAVGYITHSKGREVFDNSTPDFREVEYYEMVVTGLKDVETVEFWGKRYRVADVVEALKLLEESRTTKTSDEDGLYYRGQIYGDWS